MTVVQRWSHLDFPSALQWQAVSFIRTVWSSVDGGSLRAPYPPELRPTYYTVTRDGDLLLSLAATYASPVRVADVLLSAALLGNVFTFPAARGRGFGRRVVESATGDIRASDVDVGALLCDATLQPFYEASGWRAVPDSVTVTDDGEELDCIRMMLFLSEAARDHEQELATTPLCVSTAW